MSENIEIIKGDDVILGCTFTDENDEAVDISSADLTFTAKKRFSSDPAIQITVASGEHVSPASGITQVFISNTDAEIDAGNYFWDIQLTYGSGTINSVSAGKLTVKQDIT